MKSIQFLTNRNGSYYFRRVVPISLRSILERREIVLSLKTDDFKDACMATLEMSKELDGLFDRLRQGVGLITPPELWAARLGQDRLPRKEPNRNSEANNVTMRKMP